MVETVLLATAEEIGRVGYAALRIEDVAERAGVNKTTIYRRWPTKPALVAATLGHFTEPEEPLESGSFREELLSAVRSSCHLWGSALGKGLGRMIQDERALPEVDAIVRTLRDEYRARRRAIIARAVARGEVPEGSDAELLIDVTFAPVSSRMLRSGEPVDDAYLVRLVDFVVAGARAGNAVPRTRG
ncbi:TetR family transcriptional regulator [Chondromyces crocatus]|uniref:TetR family transcriptional regulator n=1 Tax=Chondromyces crocatus TaxID=52 RepID=A0A0K1ECJ3_CHOCO|nr:TetR family transcriptional regulator [Chondromyces crocatus]